MVAEATGAMVMAIEASQGRATVRVAVPLGAQARARLGVPLRVANTQMDLVWSLGAREPWVGVNHRPRPRGRAA